MLTPTERKTFDRTLRWIAPSGNLGDGLLLSGLLRARHETTGERFGILRQPPFTPLFLGHPAVGQIAYAEVEGGPSPIAGTEYWKQELVGQPKTLRPYARLSLMLFGEVIGPDAPWAPIRAEDSRVLGELPFTTAPILLGPAVDAPRQEWPAERWIGLVAQLRERTAIPIVLCGLKPLQALPGTVNLSGKLNPRELLVLIGASQCCIAVDPFIIHGARMQRAPTLALYGATSPAMHGYDEHVNIHTTGPCDAACLDIDRADAEQACPIASGCMAEIALPSVVTAFVERLAAGLDAARLMHPLRADKD